jgi:excinuclease UvrABC nuclease subunit
MFDGRLALVPPAVDETLAQLPAKRGVALLLTESGKPLLLLPAADLRARVTGRLKNPDEQERRRLPDLQAVTREIRWCLAHSHFESDLRFLQIARKLWPDTYTEMLAWKPAWFLRVDLRSEYPHFSRTQEVPSEETKQQNMAETAMPHAGETPVPHAAETAMPHAAGAPARRLHCFGPFVSGGAAQKFMEVLADAFDLCRDVRCLRQSPHGRRCSYGQMGKCLCPCDGSIGPADYARVVAEAAEFAAGARPPGAASASRPFVEKLQRQMRQAAAQLQFERASALKAKLQRLADLEGPDYAYVAPVEEFRFLLIQRGAGRRKLSSFVAGRASIRPAGLVEYPPKLEQLQKLVGQALAGEPKGAAPADRWAMGLVAHYLFAGPRRRGLILSVRAGLTAERVAQEIERSGEALGVKRSPKAGPP